MKEKYIDLMEKVLAAYSYEQIFEYFDEVKANGISEHGFPRLTANLGILIAKGRKKDLIDTFIEMMDFCCYTFTQPKKREWETISPLKKLFLLLWNLKNQMLSPRKKLFTGKICLSL